MFPLGKGVDGGFSATKRLPWASYGQITVNKPIRIFLVSLAFCLVSRLQGYSQDRPETFLPDAPVAQTSTSQSSSSQTPSAASPGGDQTSKAGHADQASSNTDQLKQEEKQRLLGIMPAFNTVQSGSAAPLKSSQKFGLWYRSAIDPFTFAVALVDGGIEQAENTYPEYGQGVQGFAKRFGAAYADNVDGNFWGNAVLPSLLHQDPRYFRLGQGSVKRRLGYAVLSTVRCKGDNGRWQPSYSNIGGNLIGGAISNVYYPASDRGAGLTLERGFTVTAEGAIGALAFEFYPDLAEYLKRRHDRAKGSALALPPAATTPVTLPQVAQ